MTRFTAAIVGLVLGASASTAFAEPAGLQTAPDAAMTALLSVCRPAAVQNIPASVFAQRAGYVADTVFPPNLPIVHEGEQSWRVPSSAGEVHVISGAIPEPAQKSACMVAVFGDPMTGFEDTLSRRLTAPDIGLERDARQSFVTDRFRITHFDNSDNYLVRNVMVARALTPTPDHPTVSVIAYRVDYSWLKSDSH